MPTHTLNIDILLQYTSQLYACPHCYALRREDYHDSPTASTQCAICGASYNPQTPGVAIQFDNLFGHSRALTVIASRARGFLAAPHAAPPSYAYPPMRALLDAFHTAQRFVHFTTCCMSLSLLGALKMTAQRVHVRGMVGAVNDSLAAELACPEESPYLNVLPLPKNAVSHPKTVVVIDGLIAFRGLQNLTLSDVRQSVTGCERLDIVTDINVVVQLHNDLFSTLWMKNLKQ